MKYPGKRDKKSKNDMKTISTGVEKSEGKFSKKKNWWKIAYQSDCLISMEK